MRQRYSMYGPGAAAEEEMGSGNRDSICVVGFIEDAEGKMNEKVSNHGSIPITIDCNVVAFIVFEEGFHQPIKRTKQSVFLDVTLEREKTPLNVKGDSEDVSCELDNEGYRLPFVRGLRHSREYLDAWWEGKTHSRDMIKL
ncbi:hypothetical protein TNCV_1917011 [Trichonephila clavipes]|uniref:Uncharacterized protein n=1 Tax=Trichonephila clavipes TaxID=2585209 RepID=A0A8X7BBG5_TRICX|nr:hypothetical protein TNCV_1917011 [Trichonephila clavipes]